MNETLDSSIDKKEKPDYNNTLRSLMQDITNFAQEFAFLKNPKQKAMAEKIIKSAKEYNEEVLKSIPNITDLTITKDGNLFIEIKDLKTGEIHKFQSKSDFIKILEYLKEKGKNLFEKADEKITNILNKLNEKNLKPEEKESLFREINSLFTKLKSNKKLNEILQNFDKENKGILEQTREETNKLQDETEKAKLNEIISYFEKLDKTSNDGVILAEIRELLKPHFSQNNEKIYDKLEKLYYEKFSEFAEKTRTNNLDNIISNVDNIDFSSENSESAKSISDFLGILKEKLNDKLNDKNLPKKVKEKIEGYKKEIDDFIKSTSEIIKDPKKQEELKKRIKNMLSELKEKLDTDESGYILKTLALADISKKINLGEAFLLGENNQVISLKETKIKQTFILNSPKKINSSEDLLTILPENFKEIEVNGIIYTRGKKGYFANINDAPIVEKNGKKFRDTLLTLKSGDSFTLISKEEIDPETKKSEKEAIKKAFLKDFESIAKKAKNGEKVIKTWEDLGKTLVNDDIPVIFTAAKAIGGEAFEVSKIGLVGFGKLLELIAKIVGEIFGADFGLEDMAKNLRERDETPDTSEESEEISKPANKNWKIKLNDILYSGKSYKEQLHVSQLEKTVFLDNKGNKLKEHQKYAKDLDEITKPYGVPVEVLTSLIYHESNFNPEAENGNFYGLGQINNKTFKEIKKHLSRIAPKTFTVEEIKNINNIKEIKDPRQQMELATIYLNYIKNLKPGTTWSQAILGYHMGPNQAKGLIGGEVNGKKYDADGLAKLYNKTNHFVPEGKEVNKDTYYTGAFAYYNGLTYDQAEKILANGGEINYSKFFEREINDNLVNPENLDNFEIKKGMKEKMKGILEKLDPEMKARLVRIANRVKEEMGSEYKIVLNEGFRSYEYQKELYDRLKPKGRTVASPGGSAHNYGVAIDISLYKGGKQVGYKDNDFKKFAEIAKDEGIIRAGFINQKWAQKDLVHFEKKEYVEDVRGLSLKNGKYEIDKNKKDKRGEIKKEYMKTGEITEKIKKYYT